MGAQEGDERSTGGFGGLVGTRERDRIMNELAEREAADRENRRPYELRPQGGGYTPGTPGATLPGTSGALGGSTSTGTGGLTQGPLGTTPPPPGMAQATGGAGAGAVPPYEQPGTGGLSDITKRLLNVSAEDVDYLRGEPYSTTQEQAMRAREQDRVRNQYDSARQRMIDTLGPQQGFSGVLAGALNKLNEGEASEMSAVDRDIMIKAADEMRSRLGESRGVMGGLENLENQRMLQSLGIGQEVDASQRQAIIDLMAELGLAPQLGTATQAGSNLLSAAGTLSGIGTNMANANMSGISSLASLLERLMIKPSYPSTTGGGTYPGAAGGPRLGTGSSEY